MLASEARLDAYRALPTEGGPAGKDLNAIYAACMIRKLQKPDPYAFNWSWAGRVSLPPVFAMPKDRLAVVYVHELCSLKA